MDRVKFGYYISLVIILTILRFLVNKLVEVILNTHNHRMNVIDTLIRVCKHDELQAEQCALLVHYKGKCTVKTGPIDQLKPQCSALLDAGLSAEII